MVDIKIVVHGHERAEEENGSPYEVFHTEVSVPDQVFNRKIRYSEFRSFYKTLTRKEMQTINRKFPRRNTLKNIVKEKDLDRRSTELNEFMSNVRYSKLGVGSQEMLLALLRVKFTEDGKYLEATTNQLSLPGRLENESFLSESDILSSTGATPAAVRDLDLVDEVITEERDSMVAKENDEGDSIVKDIANATQEAIQSPSPVANTLGTSNLDEVSKAEDTNQTAQVPAAGTVSTVQSARIEEQTSDEVLSDNRVTGESNTPVSPKESDFIKLEENSNETVESVGAKKESEHIHEPNVDTDVTDNVSEEVSAEDQEVVEAPVSSPVTSGLEVVREQEVDDKVELETTMKDVEQSQGVAESIDKALSTSNDKSDDVSKAENGDHELPVPKGDSETLDMPLSPGPKEVAIDVLSDGSITSPVSTTDVDIETTKKNNIVSTDVPAAGPDIGTAYVSPTGGDNSIQLQDTSTLESETLSDATKSPTENVITEQRTNENEEEVVSPKKKSAFSPMKSFKKVLSPVRKARRNSPFGLGRRRSKGGEDSPSASPRPSFEANSTSMSPAKPGKDESVTSPKVDGIEEATSEAISEDTQTTSVEETTNAKTTENNETVSLLNNMEVSDSKQDSNEIATAIKESSTPLEEDTVSSPAINSYQDIPLDSPVNAVPDPTDASIAATATAVLPIETDTKEEADASGPILNAVSTQDNSVDTPNLDVEASQKLLTQTEVLSDEINPAKTETDKEASPEQEESVNKQSFKKMYEDVKPATARKSAAGSTASELDAAAYGDVTNAKEIKLCCTIL